MNRPIQLSGHLGNQASGYVSSASYVPHGQFNVLSFGNGLSHLYTYNSRLQPTDIFGAFIGQTQPVLDLRYRWTPNDSSNLNNGNLGQGNDFYVRRSKVCPNLHL